MINIKAVNISTLSAEELKTVAKESIEEYRPLEHEQLSRKIREVTTLDTIAKALQRHCIVDSEARELKSTISNLIDKEYPDRRVKKTLTPSEVYDNLHNNCTSSSLYCNSSLYNR
ncbi:hypothetical protein ACRTAA_002927 [Clostridium perfringens]